MANMTNNASLLPVAESDVRREVRIALAERWDRTVGNMWTEADERERLRHHVEVAKRGFRQWNEAQTKG